MTTDHPIDPGGEAIGGSNPVLLILQRLNERTVMTRDRLTGLPRLASCTVPLTKEDRQHAARWLPSEVHLLLDTLELDAAEVAAGLKESA